MVTKISKTTDTFEMLRAELMTSDDGILPYDPEVQPEDVSEGKIFGLGAKERAMLSVIAFIAISVFGLAALLAHGVVVLH